MNSIGASLRQEPSTGIQLVGALQALHGLPEREPVNGLLGRRAKSCGQAMPATSQ